MNVYEIFGLGKSRDKEQSIAVWDSPGSWIPDPDAASIMFFNFSNYDRHFQFLYIFGGGMRSKECSSSLKIVGSATYRIGRRDQILCFGYLS